MLQILEGLQINGMAEIGMLEEEFAAKQQEGGQNANRTMFEKHMFLSSSLTSQIYRVLNWMQAKRAIEVQLSLTGRFPLADLERDRSSIHYDILWQSDHLL